jgi:hypothetical protein
MWEDPIVVEVRRTREDLARRAGYDVDRFIEFLHDLDRRRRVCRRRAKASRRREATAEGR